MPSRWLARPEAGSVRSASKGNLAQGAGMIARYKMLGELRRLEAHVRPRGSGIGWATLTRGGTQEGTEQAGPRREWSKLTGAPTRLPLRPKSVQRSKLDGGCRCTLVQDEAQGQGQG